MRCRPLKIAPPLNSGGVLLPPRLGDRGRFHPLWCACLRVRTGRPQAHDDSLEDAIHTCLHNLSPEPTEQPTCRFPISTTDYTDCTD